MARAAKRWMSVVAALLLLAPGARSYYHFVHYLSRTAPYAPIPEKFDLNALPGKTIYYYISDQGPTVLGPGDTFAAVVSQIRAAARVWNDVETSDVRVRFGGFETVGTPQSSPGIDIVFDDLPPGIVGLGAPTTVADPVVGPNGAIAPIQRAVVQLPRNLTSRPSYSEAFFLTVVHELGHTLGLQHTLTSSVMSTERTRATTKSKPLAADDVAGISLLYPAHDFLSNTGSIAGRVTLAGDGVAMASVVAISPNGPAVSAATNPDGTYRIDGIPAGQSYYVYAHPLPPPLAGIETTPANIRLPAGPDGRSLASGPAFDTIFFPGTKEWSQAFPVQVNAGLTSEGVNFSVQRRGAVQLHTVQTWGFPGAYAVKPPYLGRGASRAYLVATGVGLTTGNGLPAPGLRVSVMSGSESIASVRSYVTDWVQLDIQTNSSFGGDGPRHLVFSFNNDMYVLPGGFSVSQKQPPSINSVTPGFDTNGDHIATITGSNLSSDTRIVFDGQPAAVRSLDEANGRMVVTPPAGAPGSRVGVVALNSDGQSSLFLQAQALPTFDYDPGDAPALTVTPAALPAGAEAMVEINGANTSFADGQTVAGFGSSDVTVRRVWVLSQTRLLANVAVASSAAAFAPTTLTVATGLRLATQPFALQVQPPNARQLTVSSQVLNAATGQPTLVAGGVAFATVINATSLAGAVVTLNDRPTPVTAVAGNQITFQIPRDLAPGPAVLKLQVGGDASLPIVIAVDPAPPVISSVLLPPLASIRPGDLVNLMVANLADAGAQVAPNRVTINVAGVDHPALQVLASGSQHQVSFFLSPQIQPGTHTATVTIDGRTSPGFALTVVR